MPERNRILVVDDDPTSRLKIAAAVAALGHAATPVPGGQEGLDRLAEEAFDLVLLDLEMPAPDGFEVLRRIAADPALSAIPVLVISGVDEMENIVRAIELGAIDVLPKSFDSVLLRARVGAALEQRRLRRAEAADLERVETLAAAARIIEGTGFDPRRLGLGRLAAEAGDMGRLARVFLGMAERVHRREEALRRRVALLMGSLLLIAYGAANGLQPALSRLLARTEIAPMGLAAGSLVAGAVLMVLVASFAGPAWTRPSAARLLVVLGYAAASLAMPRLALLLAAEELPSQVIALLLASQSLLVFAVTALTGAEARSARRLLGLAIGLAGVGFVLLSSGPVLDLAVGAMPFALVGATVAGYATGTILLSLHAPRADENEPFHAAIALAAAAAGMTAIAAWRGDLPPPEALAGRDGLLMLALGAMGAAATLLMMVAVRVTGAIFASQGGYAATLAGVIWAVVLLGEPMPASTWIALGILVLGLVLVRPREEERDLEDALAGDPRLLAARRRLGI